MRGQGPFAVAVLEEFRSITVFEFGYDHEACAVVHPLKSVVSPVGVGRPVG